jgi:uncharacterized protein YndB with AHSA1/START domain
MAPVRKSMVVQVGTETAFTVFTAGIDRWWPKDKGIGQGPVVRSVIEPFQGGRWYTTFQDGTEKVVGHVRAWQPFERFVVSWEINSAWKSDSRVELASEVEVRFIAETPGRTRVELEHRDFERMEGVTGEKMRSDVDNGWPGMLERFAKEAEEASAVRG